MITRPLAGANNRTCGVCKNQQSPVFRNEEICCGSTNGGRVLVKPYRSWGYTQRSRTHIHSEWTFGWNAVQLLTRVRDNVWSRRADSPVVSNQPLALMRVAGRRLHNADPHCINKDNWKHQVSATTEFQDLEKPTHVIFVLTVIPVRLWLQVMLLMCASWTTSPTL